MKNKDITTPNLPVPRESRLEGTLHVRAGYLRKPRRMSHMVWAEGQRTFIADNTGNVTQTATRTSSPERSAYPPVDFTASRKERFGK